MVLRESINIDSLATFPCDWDNVSLLVHEISSHASSLSSNCPQQRINLLKAARSLTFALQTPMERILWHSWAEVGFSCSPSLLHKRGLIISSRRSLWHLTLLSN